MTGGDHAAPESVENLPDSDQSVILNDSLMSSLHEFANVKSIKQDDAEIMHSYDIANAFNTYFTTIGDSFASELLNSNIDPISFINPTNSSFSFTEINVEIVIEILKSVTPIKQLALTIFLVGF